MICGTKAALEFIKDRIEETERRLRDDGRSVSGLRDEVAVLNSNMQRIEESLDPLKDDLTRQMSDQLDSHLGEVIHRAGSFAY